MSRPDQPHLDDASECLGQGKVSAAIRHLIQHLRSLPSESLPPAAPDFTRYGPGAPSPKPYTHTCTSNPQAVCVACEAGEPKGETGDGEPLPADVSEAHVRWLETGAVGPDPAAAHPPGALELSVEEWEALEHVVNGTDMHKRPLAREAFRKLNARAGSEGACDALRSEVAWFAREMERALRRNDHKGGWKKCDMGYLRDRLREECTELEMALDAKPFVDVVREAADVANFAMMIADNIRPATEPTPPAASETEQLAPLISSGMLTDAEREEARTSGAQFLDKSGCSFVPRWWVERRPETLARIVNALGVSPPAASEAAKCGFVGVAPGPCELSAGHEGPHRYTVGTGVDPKLKSEAKSDGAAANRAYWAAYGTGELLSELAELRGDLAQSRSERGVLMDQRERERAAKEAAEANRAEWIATNERACALAEELLEERNEARAKLEAAEARVRAWQPVVYSAMIECAREPRGIEAANANAEAVERAVDAIPKDLRPQSPAPGTEGREG